MKPTIGRIVHYNEAWNVILPAIITECDDDDCVTLMVFTESTPILRDVTHGENPGQWDWPSRE